MPVEMTSSKLYISDGEIYTSVDNIQEFPVTEYEPCDIHFLDCESGTIELSKETTKAMLKAICRLKMRHLRKKFSRHNVHLMRYGKTRRVRKKNYLRTWGRFVP